MKLRFAFRIGCLVWTAAPFINVAAWAQVPSPARPIVSLEVIDRAAGETHPFQNAIIWGEFRLTRTEETNIDLPVYLRPPQGTAVFGVDYRLVGQYVGQPEVGPGSPVVVPRGLRSVNVRLYPIDDEIVEGDETAVITLSEPPAGTPLSVPYEIDPAHSSGEFVIHDNEFPVVSLEPVDREARELLQWCEPCSIDSIDGGEFRVTRTGDTNRELRVYFRPPLGTARLDVDYYLEPPGSDSFVRIPAGSRSVNVRLFSLDDALIEGDETAILNLDEPPAGTPFSAFYRADPSNASVAVVIHDDDPATPRVEITAPREWQHFAPGEGIELRAQIIGLGAAEYWDVHFYDGDQFIGTAPSGRAVSWTGAGDGRHILNAIAHTPVGVPGMDTLNAAPVTIFVEREASPVLEFLEPARNAIFSTLDEIPIELRAFAPNDLFLSGEVFANGVKIAEVSYCCWLCPCARPLPGQATILQIPVREHPDGLPWRAWQGWTNVHAGVYQLTARAVGEQGAIVQAAPVRITVIDRTLRISVQRDGSVTLVIPQGSLVPGGYDLEASSDLRTWTRLGPFQPGNVAAFYFDPPPNARGRRFYRSVYHPVILP